MSTITKADVLRALARTPEKDGRITKADVLMALAREESESDAVISKLDILRATAQIQYDKVQSMDFLAAMQYAPGGFNQFRLIYERPGELGEYLYPKDNDEARRNLYNEFSHKADVLFRRKMEAYTISTDVPQEDRDNMFRDAWNRGHANGYNEIWNYYIEVTDMYDKVVAGEITRDEFDEYLDI